MEIKLPPTTIKAAISYVLAVFVCIVLIVLAIVVVAASLDLIEIKLAEDATKIARTAEMIQTISLLDITKQVSLVVVYSSAFLFLAATAGAMYVIMQKIYGSGNQSSSEELSGEAEQEKAGTDNQESSPDGKEGKDQTISQNGGNGTRKVYVVSQNGGGNGIRTDNHITMLIGILISGVFVLMAFRVDHTLSTLKDDTKKEVVEEARKAAEAVAVAEIQKEEDARAEALMEAVAAKKAAKEAAEDAKAAVAEAKAAAAAEAEAREAALDNVRLEIRIGELDREIAELRRAQVQEQPEVARESAQVVAEAIEREAIGKDIPEKKIKRLDKKLREAKTDEDKAEVVVEAEVAIAEERINEAENTREAIESEFQFCAEIIISPFEGKDGTSLPLGEQLNAAKELSEYECFDKAIEIYEKIYEAHKASEQKKFAAEAKLYQARAYFNLDNEKAAIQALEIVKGYKSENGVKEFVIEAEGALVFLTVEDNRQKVIKLREIVKEYEGDTDVMGYVEEFEALANFYDTVDELESNSESSQ